jgi:hypothetical protein
MAMGFLAGRGGLHSPPKPQVQPKKSNLKKANLQKRAHETGAPQAGAVSRGVTRER